MHYYSHNIGDYRRDTAHLSLLEHGAYRQLLDWYYLNEEKIPIETEVVFRRLSAKTEVEKSAVLSVLSDFFLLVDGGYAQGRCDAEIGAYHGKAETARVNGKLGGRPKKTKVVILDNPEITGSQANHKPITNNHKQITIDSKAIAPSALGLFQDVSQQVISDFQKLRSQKKAPITKTAVDGIQREATKAGLSLESALMLCCERGWTGFKAEWVLSDKQKNGGQFANSGLGIHGQATAEAAKRWLERKNNERQGSE